MDNPVTSAVLIVLTLLAAAAGAVALRRLGRGEPPRGEARLQASLVAVIGLGAAGVFLGRWALVHHRWQPLAAHVDGLVLIAALLAATALFIQSKPRLYGLSAFALPLLTLILAWGICAAAWTYRPFALNTLGPVWLTVHLAGVYLGTLCAAVGAIAGGMYLYVRHRLKTKHDLRGLGKLASLETLETLVMRAATLGFALLSLGLASGFVIVTEDRGVMGPGWWYSPKIMLAVAAWAVYAVVINVRHSARFRGARAAWLAIFGLVLLIATYSAATALPPGGKAPGGKGGNGPGENSRIQGARDRDTGPTRKPAAGLRTGILWPPGPPAPGPPRRGVG